MDLLQWADPASRAGDPMTSHLAATKAATGASQGRMLVLMNLAVMPMTDFELAEATGWQQTSIGKRRHELMVPRGFVERAKDADGDEIRRLSPSGSPSLVWALTKAGRDYYTEVCRVRD